MINEHRDIDPYDEEIWEEEDEIDDVYDEVGYATDYGYNTTWCDPIGYSGFGHSSGSSGVDYRDNRYQIISNRFTGKVKKNYDFHKIKNNYNYKRR